MLNEETLKDFLVPLVHGTGTLPGVEPWRTIAKQARRLGCDSSGVTDHVWTAVYAAHGVTADAAVLMRSLVMRAIGIGALMLGLRIAITKMTDNNMDTIIPWWGDLLMVLGAFLMMSFVVLTARSAVPRSWIVANDSNDPSPDFFAWLEMLVLGNNRLMDTTHGEFVGARTEIALMKSKELRDGICREAQRRMMVTELASSLTRRDRVALARFSATLPLLDLLVAGILGPGFCGAPVIRWLMDSGVS